MADPTNPNSINKKQQDAKEELGRNSEQIDLLKEKLELQRQYLEALEQQAEIERNIIHFGETAAQAKKRLEQEVIKARQQALFDEQELQNTLNSEYEQLAAQKAADSKAERDRISANLAKLSEFIEASNKEPALTREIEKAAAKIGSSLDTLKDDLEELENEAGSLGRILDDAFGKMPGILGDLYKSGKTLKASLGTVGEEITKLGSAQLGAVPGMKSMLTNTGTLITDFSKLSAGATASIIAVGLIAKKFFDLAMSADNLSKELGAATGFGNQFSHELGSMAMQGTMAGIGMKEASESLKTMTEGLSSFNPEAEATNEYVGLTVARLSKLGVSSASAVKSIDYLQRGMGKSAKQASNMTAQIAMMGKAIGVTGTKMIEQFNAASAKLAVFGDRNIKVFKGLAAAAKASGIEMGTLISVAENFNTFDKAAQSAAGLNAVLGTQIDHLKMMSMEYDDRIMYLKQEVQMSVGNFDSLDMYTKQMIAQQIGVSSVDEAQRLLNMSTSEYLKYKNGQKEQADIQDKLAETTEQLVPIMDQFKLAISQVFLVAAPLFEGFSWFISTVGPGLMQIVKGLTAVGIVLAVLAGWQAILTFETGVFAGIMTALGWTAIVAAISAVAWGIGWLVDELFAFFDITHKTGSPMLYMIPKFLAESFSMLADGISIAAGFLADFVMGPLNWLYDTLHLSGSPLLFMLPLFLADSFIKLAESVGNVFGQMTDFVKVMADFASLDFKGFVAIRSEGGSTSMIMGSEDVITSLNKGKLTVDVKMPEISMPKVEVKVYIGDRQLKDIIRTEVHQIVGAAG